MDTEEQIRGVFQNVGMNPQKIQYNESLDRYVVNIGVIGTDEQFREGISGLDDEEPVTESVDTTALKRNQGAIHGSSIPNGTINIIETMTEGHFLIKIS